MKINSIQALALAGATLALSASAVHAQDWKVTLVPSATTGTYQSSLARERYSDVGLSAYAERGKDWSMALGLGNTTITQKNANPTLEQQNIALSGSWHTPVTMIPGRLTARLDVYRVKGTDSSGNPDTVDTSAPQLSWLSQDSSLYADLGYARSRYSNGLSVDQVTPTFGFAFNDAYEWVQLRAYQMSGMDPLLAAGKSSASALETSWTHYFKTKSAYMPSFATLGVVTGERIYTVDRDAMSISNVADLQTGATRVSATWKLSKTTRLTALIAQSRFRNVSLDNNYQLNVAYLNAQFDF